MTDEQRKRLTLYLGECYHETELVHPIEYGTLTCVKCGENGPNKNRTFTTIQDFYDLKCKMVEMGEWEEFHDYAWTVWTNTGEEKVSNLNKWLIHPDRCETVAAWLRRRGIC